VETEKMSMLLSELWISRWLLKRTPSMMGEKKKRVVGGGPVVDCWTTKRRRLRI